MKNSTQMSEAQAADIEKRARLSVLRTCSRIDQECKRQGVTTVLLGRVMGVSTRKARAVRTGRNGRVMIVDIIMAARALDVPLERLLSVDAG